MVKGVSKTVIVVNNTGSRLFEKIVFYVTPEYGNLSSKQLKKAAGNFNFNFEETPSFGRLRMAAKRRRLIKLLCLATGILILLSVILAWIL